MDENKKRGRQSLPHQYPKCDICGEDIKVTPRILNLTYLTGIAGYHRQCSQDRLKLCINCSKEMSDVIDNWILKKNKSLKKFRV